MGGYKYKLLNIRKYDSESLASKVLSIGIDWRRPRGGVAAVENVYSTFYSPFNHIATVVDGNFLAKSWTAIKAFFCFIGWMLFRREIKIVHVHGASNSSFWRKRIFISLAKVFNKKVVYHCHGAEYKRFSAQHHIAVNSLLKKCNCVIALSESWKEWFQNEFGLKNVVVIKNVIAKPNVSKHEKKDGEPFILLFLGRLGKRKGIFDLLDVLANNKAQYNGKVRLLVGGDGEVETVKNIMKEREIGDIVNYEGWVSGEKKEQLLNIADAYILPSYNEGLPISVLEAMSYGLPIISTNVGGIPEILKNGENGFIMEPGDKNGMKQAINTLMNDKSLRERMGERSLQIVQPHLPEFVAAQLAELYNSILEK